MTCVFENFMREQKSKYLAFGLKASGHTKFFDFLFLLGQEDVILHDGGPPGAARRCIKYRPLAPKGTEKHNILVWLLAFNPKYKYFAF